MQTAVWSAETSISVIFRSIVFRARLPYRCSAYSVKARTHTRIDKLSVSNLQWRKSVRIIPRTSHAPSRVSVSILTAAN